MRGFVFIDGSNFCHKLKDLTAGRKQEFPLSSFDFHAFATWLAAPGELAGVRYYIGAVKRDGSEKSQSLYADQQRLIGRLQQQGVEIVLGHLIRHPDRTFHEKGVDVRLAVEMIRLAREGRYDQAYLLRGRLRSRYGSGERGHTRAGSAVQRGATLAGGMSCGQRRAGLWSAISAPGRP